jgi:hypothetical protein
MNSSRQKLVDVKVEIPEDVLMKVQKIATEKNMSVEDALVFLIEVASHR